MSRQSMFDDTYHYIPTQAWMILPFIQYHGGEGKGMGEGYGRKTERMSGRRRREKEKGEGNLKKEERINIERCVRIDSHEFGLSLSFRWLCC